MNTFINNQKLAKLAGVNFDSETIQPGNIVYSRTHTIKKQFHTLASFPSCVLITSFSDACCASEMAKDLPTNVKKWFSNNVVTKNPRVVAVPIGLCYSLEIEDLIRSIKEQGRNSQSNLMYMNFSKEIPRRVNPRKGLYEQFEKKSWVTTEGGLDHITLDQFYNQINSHPYVLSPPGAGPDCHRHWESILLGSIPIVKKSPVTRLLDGLPCLQVDSWEEITEERLLKELPKLTKLFNSPRMEICYFEYWHQRILEI